MYLSRGDVRIGRRVLCTKVATGVGNGGVGERAIWHADRALVVHSSSKTAAIYGSFSLSHVPFLSMNLKDRPAYH